MKKLVTSLALITSSLVGLGGTLVGANVSGGDASTLQNQMIIRIGSNTFTATLAENATATAFKALLPLTLNMADLNDNEKVVALAANLPTNDSNPKHIEAGDLMLWSSRSVVLFYKSFPTSYSYTRLGRINDVSGLAAAVGAGNVTVTFQLASGN